MAWEDAVPDGTHLTVWVDATNGANESATDLRAEMRGADPAIVLWDKSQEFQGTVRRGASETVSFRMIPRTTATVAVQVTNNAPLGALGLALASPGGQNFTAAGTGATASIQLTQSDVEAGIFGDWVATVSHAGGLQTLQFVLTVSSQYTDAFENVSLAELPAGATYRFYFNIWSESPPHEPPPGVTITLNATVHGEGEPVRLSFVAAPGQPVQRTAAQAGAVKSEESMVGVAVGISIAASAALAALWWARRKRWPPFKGPEMVT
jgi:hypothetical protein